jgi:hypothetical protein
MLKNISLIVTVILFSSSLLFAQKALEENASGSDNLLKDWSIGFNYGATKFDGDITQYNYAPSTQTELEYQDEDFKELRYAFSFSLEKKIDERTSISVEHVFGEFAGLRRPNEYIGFETDDPYGIIAETTEGMNGQKFVTTFNETDVLLNYNLNSDISKLIKTEMPENLSIIVKVGFGLSQFRSLRTNLYSDEYIYSHGYEELTKNESDVVSESVMVFGGKIKYKMISGVSLLLDYTLRVNNSDRWDSSIMKSDNAKDKFSLFSLGLAYDLGTVASKDKLID